MVLQMAYFSSLSSSHRSSTSSVTKWLWRRSAPSDWLLAGPDWSGRMLMSLPALWHRAAPCRPEATRQNMCLWVCVSQRTRLHILGSDSICVIVTTHPLVHKRKRDKDTHTNTHACVNTRDFHVCACFPETVDSTCLYKIRKGRRNGMFDNKSPTSFAVCPLRGCDVAIVQFGLFSYILHLNVVSLWELDAHWKIFSNIVEGQKDFWMDVFACCCEWLLSLVFLTYCFEMVSWCISMLVLLTAAVLNTNESRDCGFCFPWREMATGTYQRKNWYVTSCCQSAKRIITALLLWFTLLVSCIGALLENKNKIGVVKSI